MKQLVEEKNMPTAVMCSNDMTAIGVLHQANSAGVRIPDDLSVIGFDDIHIAEVMIPALTTVEMSRYEIARAAVAALREQLEGSQPVLGKHEYAIGTRLIVRQSTGFPRGSMMQLRKEHPIKKEPSKRSRPASK